MILSNLKDQRVDGRRRISMDFCYEDSERPSGTLYFEACEGTAERMRPRVDGFAIAFLPLAMWHRERRLRVEGTLCRRLASGLPAINDVFLSWYPHYTRIAVEPVDGFAVTWPSAERRTASMLSGGIDGLAALRLNRLHYPLDHPESIRDCITLFGINNFDLDYRGPVPERLAAFDERIGRLAELAAKESFTLHAVYTNIRSLAPSYRYWTRMGFGAAHISVAQLFHGYMDTVLYASDGDGANPPPGAWHPLIVPHFSTDAVRVQATEVAMKRVEKTEVVSAWEYGRRYMQPCHWIHIPESGRINCGRCEKCIRTMLTLIGLGRLKEVSAFDEDDVPPSLLFQMSLTNRVKADLLQETIPGLLCAGRRDLARAVRARLALYRLFRR